ncbi:Reverse transcriptase domain-containing protein [Mycena venus]|uniref:Reverse transcriptase domain-containing protein n=1 Tax=Mycena venus TaxID=2733690 RepID=A0A8H6YQW7_9AGAR|nr:Reverse transcriptase domain-containing protein [Mycena venus]
MALPNLPNTADFQNRRNSRLFSQIQPLTPPTHTSGGLSSGPINPAPPLRIRSVRDRVPSEASLQIINAPKLVLTPQTPEHPRVYPVSLHLRLYPAQYPYSGSPIPFAHLDEAEETPAEAGPAIDSHHSAASSPSHHSAQLPLAVQPFHRTANSPRTITPVGSQHGVPEAAGQPVDPGDQGPAGPLAADQAPAGPPAGAGDQGGGGNGGNGDPPGPPGLPGPLYPQGPPDPQSSAPPPPPPGPGAPGGGGGGGPPRGGGGGGGPPVPPPAPGPIPGPGRRPPPARALDPPNALEALFTSTLVGLNDALNCYANQSFAPRSNCSLLRNPDTFNGSDPSKLCSFMTQCYLHFAKHEQDFPTDDDKILFTLSYLRGTAQKWFEPNLYDPTPGAILAWDGNFLLFVKELTDNLGPQDPVGDAEDPIRQCRMKSSDRIATYIVAFDHLAAITGWGDWALRHQFYEGLPNQIKDEMVHHTYINNLPGNKEVACRIDARYWQRELEKQRERAHHPPGNPGAGQGAGGARNPSGGNRGNKGPSSKSTLQPNPSGQKGSRKPSRGNPKDQSGTGNRNTETGSSQKKAKPYADKLGKDRKLKPEEHEQRLKAGLCLLCGGSGHTTDNCKKQNNPLASSRNSSGKAATTMPAPAAAETGKTLESKK